MDTFDYILLYVVAGLCILILNKLGSLETRVFRLHQLLERDRQASPQPTEDPRPEQPQSPTASAAACTAESPALNREAEKTASLAESPQPSPELLPAPESSPGPEFSHAPERQQGGAAGEAQPGAHPLVEPVVVDGVFDEEADADNQHEDADGGEK